MESFADWQEIHEPAPGELEAIARNAKQLAECIADTRVLQLLAMTDRLTTEEYVEICEGLDRLAWAAERRFPARARGRRKLPSWLDEAAKFLFAIWQRKTGTPARPYFTETGTTQPANDFTRWFCNTMRRAYKDVTISQCQTVMNRTYRASDKLSE